MEPSHYTSNSLLLQGEILMGVDTKVWYKMVLRFVNVGGAIGLILDVDPGHGITSSKTRYNYNMI